jgi:hypothetical protein
VPWNRGVKYAQMGAHPSPHAAMEDYPVGAPGRSNGTIAPAIPAYAQKILCDYGSARFSARFVRPFASFDMNFVS